jgi:secreted Zn-dependent insulinase-like peptidase
LQDLLEKFYHANYSSNLMKLVIESSHAVDVMQGWV